jgi:hypothetical protein
MLQRNMSIGLVIIIVGDYHGGVRLDAAVFMLELIADVPPSQYLA